VALEVAIRLAAVLVIRPVQPEAMRRAVRRLPLS